MSAELAGLARALRAHVRRRASLGLRRTPAAAPRTAAAVGARPPVTPPPPVAAAPPVAPPTDVARTAPARPTPAAPAPAVTPAPREGAVAALRERAAGAPDLAALRALVAECTACDLCQSRTQTVFADGGGSTGVMFVGEAPGFHEDRQGVPFVGNAGGLLTDIIRKGMGLAREDVFIANVLKCRPPENRDPEPLEKELCTAWLDRQIELVDPKIVIALGRHAAGHLLGQQTSIGRLRGRVHDRNGRPVVVTYHPSFLLRTPAMKRDCWQDIQLAMRTIGLPVPGRA